MAEISRNPLGYKTKKFTMLITSIVGIPMITAIVWGGIVFSKYRGTDGVPEISAPPAQVSFSNLQNGRQVEAGESLTVEVNAIGPNAFASIELWLNGELAGVQAAPTGGAQPFTTNFSWLPFEKGSHTLLASAIDVNGQKVMSPQVVVLVVEGEFSTGLLPEGMEEIEPVFPPPPQGGGYSPPPVPENDVPINPAGIWAGTIGDFATSLLTQEEPNAPDLAVGPRECAASLYIHDLSNNEEGFIVYRQIINTPDWHVVATLSSQSEVEWLSYLDEGVSGAVAYYVSAFNSQGETKSNPVQVIIDPASCPEYTEDTMIEKVDASLKLTDGSADWVYCYKSSDGIHWSRWPAVGFLTPDAEGNLPSGPISYQRLLDTKTGLSTTPVGLTMECWGWQGGGLSRLGDILIGDLEPDLTGKHLAVGNGINAEVAYEVDKFSSLSALFLTTMQDEEQPVLPPGKPISPDIPRVKLSVTQDRNVCGMHLPFHVQSYIQQLEFCFQYPEYDPVHGGVTPQPYLVWDFDPEPVCAGGPGEECKSYQELLALAEENGGQVGFTIHSIRGGIKNVWNVTEPYLTMLVVPPLACIGETAFNVQMWYRPGKKDVAVSASPGDQISEVGDYGFSPPETFFGPYSNWITVPCHFGNLMNPTIIEMVQYLDITFEGIELDNVDDDDVGKEVVELYGYFGVDAPSIGILQELPCFFDGWNACDEGSKVLTTIGDRRYLILAPWGTINGPEFSDGYYDLIAQKLCQSTSKSECEDSVAGAVTIGQYNNQTVRVYAKEGDVLTIFVKLVDYDENSDDDRVCHGSASWQLGTFYNPWWITAHGEDNLCDLYTRVDFVGDPVPLTDEPLYLLTPAP